jgi:hypothetical protein
LCAWLIRFPACGFLPQISHCCAMITPITTDSRSFLGVNSKPYFTGQSSIPTIRTVEMLAILVAGSRVQTVK